MCCAENTSPNLGFPGNNDLLLKIACKSLIVSKSWIQTSTGLVLPFETDLSACTSVSES